MEGVERGWLEDSDWSKAGGVGRWGELGVSQTALWNQGRWKGGGGGG